MRRRDFIASLLLAGFVAGCSTTSGHPEWLDAEANAPYRLASGDRLRVIVFGQDSLSNSFSVDGAGNVAMPLIGAVRAQGSTTLQLAASLEARLRDGYLRDPRVSVEVEAFRPFFALGEVGVAGQYPFINGMTVANAVAVAGGFSPRAARSSVDVTRVVGGQSVTASVPLSFPLRPGDTITVRERFF